MSFDLRQHLGINQVRVDMRYSDFLDIFSSATRWKGHAKCGLLLSVSWHANWWKMQTREKNQLEMCPMCNVLFATFLDPCFNLFHQYSKEIKSKKGNVGQKVFIISYLYFIFSAYSFIVFVLCRNYYVGISFFTFYWSNKAYWYIFIDVLF